MERTARRVAGATSAVVVMAATALGLALGYGRDVAVAARFGAGEASDALFIGLMLPTILWAVLVTGTLVPALVPPLSAMLARGDVKGARRSGGAALGLLLPLMLGLVAGGWWLSDALVALLAPALPPAAQGEAAVVLRLGWPTLGLLVLAGWAGALLQADGRFAWAALAPAAVNGGGLAGALLLAPLLGVRGVALGMLGGSALHAACGLVALARARRSARTTERGRGLATATEGRRPSGLDLPPAATGRRAGARDGDGSAEGWLVWPRWPLDDAGLRGALGLAGPLALALALGQVYLLVERPLGAALGSGVVSHLSFALKLNQWPTGIFATALATTTYPALAALLAPGAPRTGRHAARARILLLRTLRLGLLCAVPAAAFLLGGAMPLTRLVYARGSFDEADVAATAAALVAYAPGVVPLVISTLLLRACYACGEVGTALRAGVLATAGYVVAAVAGAAVLGSTGLALALSLYQVILAAAVWRALRRRLGPLVGPGAPRLAAHLGLLAGAATLLVAIATALAEREGLARAGAVANLLMVASNLALAVGVVLVGGYLLGLSEIRRLAAARLRWQPVRLGWRSSP